MNHQQTHPNRVRWACRRGMLELDVLLLTYFEQVYHHLSLEQQTCFSRMLRQDDTTLYAWLMGQASPDSPEMVSMIDEIRQACANV